MPQTIFITGSSKGLGRATALLFASRGWNVIATLRSPNAAQGLAEVKNISLIGLDVTRPEQVRAATAEALSRGPVDVVFNNAGYALSGPFEATDDAQIVSEIETNLIGVLRVTRAFIPAFRQRGKGTFIATTSVGGHVTFPFNSVYHATKWALEGWSESLAYELGAFGIRVKTVAPGAIHTDFHGRSLVLADDPAYATLVGKALGVLRAPARAVDRATAEQIAEVVYEAATDESDQMTYLAGSSAKAMVAQRRDLGIEAWRRSVTKMFLG
jgi:NAD(P)-dependent dehydrogenase (short-subunit alcohol dehydrogenase family)